MSATTTTTTINATTTATQPGHSTQRIQQRRHRRRLSAPTVSTRPTFPSPPLRLRLHHSYQHRQPNAHALTNNFTGHFGDRGVSTNDDTRTLDALDLTSASPTHTLASLRFLILTYLASLEKKLSALAFGSTPTSPSEAVSSPIVLENPKVSHSDLAGSCLDLDAIPSPPSDTNDTKQWAQKALLILQSIRTDVCSHLPDINLHDLDAIAFVKSHLPHMHIPEFDFDLSELGLQLLPDFPDLDTLRTNFHDLDLDFEPPLLTSTPTPFTSDILDGASEDSRSGLSYISTLSAHLAQLHSHLSSSAFFSARPCGEYSGDGINGGLSTPHLFEMLEHLLQDVRTTFAQRSFGPSMNGVLTSVEHAMSSVETHLENAMSSMENTIESAFDQGEEMLERAACEVALAVQRSFDGMKLISYSDLPKEWKNNHFVETGYRFIPVEKWHLLVLSMFKWHNETLNIHTHLIPFLLWLPNILSVFWTFKTFSALPSVSVPAFLSALTSHLPSLPMSPSLLSVTSQATQRTTRLTAYLTSSTPPDAPELLFMSFALLCLFSSAVWHTMSGCADRRSMEFCARVDYVGIGWLISASVGTVVYYGFQECHPNLGWAFLGLCFCTGLAGNVFPFMKWFNMREYRFYRIGFFLSLAFSAVGPMVALSAIYSWKETHEFVAPVFPSLISYIVGLVFYAAHFPECFLPEGVQRKLDVIGGGSHAIWHCFIVLAVSQHKAAIQTMKKGMECSV